MKIYALSPYSTIALPSDRELPAGEKTEISSLEVAMLKGLSDIQIFYEDTEKSAEVMSETNSFQLPNSFTRTQPTKDTQ